VETQDIVNQTATATLWTDTPTPNITASINAYRTQQAAEATAQHVRGLTATADSWTDTPTATYTPSSTPTFTLTPSFTPTATPTMTLTNTPSHTPTFTPTVTPMPTNTATNMPSHTPTFTVTPSDTPTNTATFTPTNTPLPRGYPGGDLITVNDQWQVDSRDFEGVEMVLVPAGCFMMGSTQEQIDLVMELCGGCNRSYFEAEYPPTEICLSLSGLIATR
jgi:hypothetical protein